MEQAIRVSIIGESVLVEGIVVSLEGSTQVNIQRIQIDNQDALQLIAGFNPEVIIFPLGCSDVETILSQVRMKPDVRLIGVDIECNQVLVMDNQLHRSLSLEALQQLIAVHGLDLFETIETSYPKQKINNWHGVTEKYGE